MPYKFYTVTARNAQGEAELNAFLESHRILHVDRRWIDMGENSYWALCIEYLGPDSSPKTSVAGKSGTSNKVDYRDLLNQEDFALFSELREFRKRLATAEAVPPYIIFTNDQISQIVQKRIISKADLAKIDGVGEARVEKYGDRLIEFLKQSGLHDEACGKPV